MIGLLNIIREETVTRNRRHSQEGYIRRAAGYMVASGIPIGKVGEAGYRKSLLMVAATIAYDDGMPNLTMNKSSVGNALNGVGTKDNDTAQIKSYADEYKSMFSTWHSEAMKSGNPTKWIQDNRKGYRYNTSADGSVVADKNDKGEIIREAVTTYKLSDAESKLAFDNLTALVS